MKNSGHYLVMLCDVVDYSRMDPKDQVAAVALLWKTALAEQGALYSIKPSDTVMWGTGDGLYLATVDTSLDRKLALWYLCRLLIKALQIEGKNLRAGLHQGRVNFVPVDDTKKRFELSGPALNECARIVPYAADGQVVLSEEFARDIIDSPRSDALRHRMQLHPHPSQDPFRASVKHGIVMSVRFDSHEDSHRVKNLSMCGQALDVELQDIIDWICDTRLNLSREALGVRITIFKSERNEYGKVDSFTGTPFRFDSLKVEGKPDLSRTIYAVNPTQGIAISFVDRAPRYVSSLPDPTTETENYHEQVEQRWKVPKPVSKEWGKKARAFFAIPLFAYNAPDEKPIAMICIDFEHPLDHLSESELSDFANDLVEVARFRLGPLWKCLG